MSKRSISYQEGNPDCRLAAEIAFRFAACEMIPTSEHAGVKLDDLHILPQEGDKPRELLGVAEQVWELLTSRPVTPLVILCGDYAVGDLHSDKVKIIHDGFQRTENPDIYWWAIHPGTEVRRKAYAELFELGTPVVEPQAPNEWTAPAPPVKEREATDEELLAGGIKDLRLLARRHSIPVRKGIKKKALKDFLAHELAHRVE